MCWRSEHKWELYNKVIQWPLSLPYIQHFEYNIVWWVYRMIGTKGWSVGVHIDNLLSFTHVLQLWPVVCQLCFTNLCPVMCRFTRIYSLTHPKKMIIEVSRPRPDRLQACPWASITGLFSPFTLPCVRLSSDHWLFRGKGKGKGVALNFPYGFRFSCWVVVFLVSPYLHLGFPGCPRPGTGCPCYS